MILEIIILLAILSLLLTCAQLLDLMRQKDDAFPGRHDKILWFILILFTPLLGAILYSIRRPNDFTVPSPPSLQREWEKIQKERNQSRPETTK